MTKMRVGFIGAGGIAGRHFGNLLEFDDVAVVAVADPALERAQALAERSAGKAYLDHNQMLESEKLDALYICTPPFAHGAPELAAIERGVPFFVEKPLAVDGETAEEIARRVEQKGLVTGVGYHWRYLDTVERASELLSKNPARLALGYWLDGTPPVAWWWKEEMSGGQMVEQTTHIFDLARLLMGEVETVFAMATRTDRPNFPESDVADVSAATLHFESGAIGTMASTCVLSWPHRVGLHLFSEGMAIELSEHEVMIDVGQGRPVYGAQGDPFKREDRDFIDAAQGKSDRIRSPYSEALKTHRLTMAANRSAREGSAVSLAAEGVGV